MDFIQTREYLTDMISDTICGYLLASCLNLDSEFPKRNKILYNPFRIFIFTHLATSIGEETSDNLRS